MKGEHPVRLLCALLSVAPSGYYRWRRGDPSQRQGEDAAIAAQIVVAHEASRGNYEVPCILDDLRDADTRTSKRRCGRLMRAVGLRGRKKHARQPRTTDSRHPQPVAPNLIAERPAPTGPNQCWLTNITYLKTADGWLYLAAILGLWSRKIVGWACAPSLHTSLVLAALTNALQRRQPRAGLLHHSDRGSQYVDGDDIEALLAAGIERRISRAGNCYDDAAMESFWSALKTDTGLDQATPDSRRHAELAVFDYIETFYHTTRRHSSLGNISPVVFEKQNILNNSKAVQTSVHFFEGSPVARVGAPVGSGALRYTPDGIWTSAHDVHALS